MATLRQQQRVHSPDWKKLSQELVVVLQQTGPLLLGDVGGAFHKIHGTGLKLHGYKLSDCLAQGKLHGVRLSKDKTTLELTNASTQLPKNRAAPVTIPVNAMKPTSQALNTSGIAPTSTGVPHALVTGLASWNVALRLICSPERVRKGGKLTLQEVCTDHPIALRLHGKGLGTKNGSISLIVIAGGWPEPKALIFDVVTLGNTPAGQALLRDELCPVLGDEKCVKVVHDFTNDAIALRYHFGQGIQISTPLDIQLAFEALRDSFRVDFISVIKAFGGKDGAHMNALRRSISSTKVGSTARPLIPSALEPVAQEAVSTFEAIKNIQLKLTAEKEWANVVRASQMITDFAMQTMLRGQRRCDFVDKGTCWGGGVGRVIISHELKRVLKMSEISESPKKVHPPRDFARESTCIRSWWQPPTPVFGRTTPSKIEAVSDPNSLSEVLGMVPPEFLEEKLSARHQKNLENLHELVLDEGTRPRAQLQGRGKVYLCKNEHVVVTQHHIDQVVGRLVRGKKIGSDNRAGFPGQLHRVSVMKDKVGMIYGVTLRIGRFFKGSAGLIDDILFHVADSPETPKRAASILILGEAGTGKTTVIRDICRKISASQTVLIVDTSNEIAGDGAIPHREAIGDSRRIMVAHRADQHRVMIEALQNHTPQTIVVDEISNTLEARACGDIKARGVRLVASAHGDLQSLLKNPSLNSLLGGTTSVTLGDELAKATQGGNKVQTQRAGAPVFDMVIELQRGKVNTWSIIRNVAHAVDALLSQQPYDVERRTRLGDTSGGGKDGDSEDATFMLQVDSEVEKSQQYY